MREYPLSVCLFGKRLVQIAEGGFRIYRRRKMTKLPRVWNETRCKTGAIYRSHLGELGGSLVGGLAHSLPNWAMFLGGNGRGSIRNKIVGTPIQGLGFIAEPHLRNISQNRLVGQRE